jgi:hypothetical protein
MNSFVFVCGERVPSIQGTSWKILARLESRKWKSQQYDHCVVTGPSSGGGRTNVTCLSPLQVADALMTMAARDGASPVWVRYSRKVQVEEVECEEHKVRCSSCGDGGCVHCDPSSFGIRVAW